LFRQARLLGIAFLINSLWLLLLTIPLVVIFQKGVIEPEERYLERNFGENHLGYQDPIRRWISSRLRTNVLDALPRIAVPPPGVVSRCPTNGRCPVDDIQTLGANAAATRQQLG
jgi:hypothetical protein